MDKIKNRAKLLSHGCRASREIVLEITERMLRKADSYNRICEMMHLEGDRLRIGKKVWDLSQKRNVYLLGAGKACNAMVMAVEHVLGDRLTGGIAIVKIREETDLYKKTDVYVGGHPLPNASGVAACGKILDLVNQAGPDDLFIAVISGGSTALMCCPVDGISLQDKIDTTDIMLKSGAKVSEINAVRRHLSQINGGRLGQRIRERGAELIGITIFDDVGKPATEDITIPVPLEGTPIGPDPTTFKESLASIYKYGLEKRLPQSVIQYLQSQTPENETPKHLDGFTYYIINTVPDSCCYARQIAEEMGLNVMVLTTYLEGDSKSTGTCMASIAREIQQNKGPVAPPCVLLSSGETTTLILDNREIKGHGGPSQELVTSFALSAAAVPGACALSIDSEGTDGTTAAAGGITDSTTLATAKELGFNLMRALREHATGELLAALGDQVITGNTGTNLCDFNILYVPEG